MARVVLVVPCYDEADRLPGAAFRDFSLPGHELRVLFVDDGSRDDTGEVLGALCEASPSRLELLRLERNRGKAEAVRRGVEHALASSPAPTYVGYWDADLATPLSELPRLCDMLDTHPDTEAVLGSRVRMLGHDIDRRAHRHAYGRVFATAVATVLSMPVYDTQCGSKLFRGGPDLARVFATPFVSRWVFDVEILARYIALWEPRGIDAAAHIYELPLQHWTHVEGSKIGPRDAALAFVDLARIATRYREPLEQRRRR